MTDTPHPQTEYCSGKVIILNGTSSAGKSTLARALREAMAEPFCYFSSDQLAETGFRALREFPDDSPTERDRFFDGFHRSIAAFAMAGNHLIVDHIVEKQDWKSDILTYLVGIDTFWVGVHAPIPELERRERARGDRAVGEALFHLKTHKYCSYDIEIDSTAELGDNVKRIVAAWQRRTEPACSPRCGLR
jgi:chloramphenicol 3-O phosphotransferase